MKDQARYRWIEDHVLPFEREVRRWLRRKVRTLSPDDVNDLVQEGYSRLLDANLSHVRNGRSFFARTLYNLWLDQRRRARVVQIDLHEDVDPVHIDDAPGPEQRASARQQVERLVQAIQQLPARQRAAFELRQFVGLSYREIADRMNIAEATVEMHLRLAFVEVTRLILIEDGIGRPASGSCEVDDDEATSKQDRP